MALNLANYAAKVDAKGSPPKSPNSIEVLAKLLGVQNQVSKAQPSTKAASTQPTPAEISDAFLSTILGGGDVLGTARQLNLESHASLPDAQSPARVRRTIYSALTASLKALSNKEKDELRVKLSPYITKEYSLASVDPVEILAGILGVEAPKPAIVVAPAPVISKEERDIGVFIASVLAGDEKWKNVDAFGKDAVIKVLKRMTDNDLETLSDALQNRADEFKAYPQLDVMFGAAVDLQMG